jgi:hypothetical protein
VLPSDPRVPIAFDALISRVGLDLFDPPLGLADFALPFGTKLLKISL